MLPVSLYIIGVRTFYLETVIYDNCFVTWNLIHDEVIDNGGRINYPTLCFKFRGTSFEKNLPYAVRINYSDVHVLVRVLVGKTRTRLQDGRSSLMVNLTVCWCAS